MSDPRTVPEMLDAAKDSGEFGAVILGLFGALERAMDDDDE